MNLNEKLVAGKYYHIYNCGINGENLFRIKEDYIRFLRLYDKYIYPIAETYAWVLMKNHFHLLVKIKENIVYKYSNESGIYDKERFNNIKWETLDLADSNVDKAEDTASFQDNTNSKLLVTANRKVLKNNLKPTAHLHFSHLFNAYAKYFNIKYDRHGALFERQFKRKHIDNRKYFRTVVVYIHQNPVHHKFCDNVMDYGWSSYLTCISIKPTSLKRTEVVGWFDEIGNFKSVHNKTLNVTDIEKYLEF